MSGYVLLEDGTRFDGELLGSGEAVTDPSYAGQIITFTYPLIGNYGVSSEAMESDRVHARGVVMRDAKNADDVATAEGGWLDWLRDCGVAAIEGVDTRQLVRHIRDRGAMRGGIFSSPISLLRSKREPTASSVTWTSTPLPSRSSTDWLTQTWVSMPQTSA